MHQHAGLHDGLLELFDVAHALRGKRASIARLLLDARSGIGTAWRQKNGGYAA